MSSIELTLLLMACTMTWSMPHQQQSSAPLAVPFVPGNTITKCNQRLDVVFAIDGSNSMFESNFNLQKEALVNLVNDLNVGPFDIHVGVILFSSTVISYRLSGNKQQVISNINQLHYPNEGTRTDLAINEASNLFNRDARGGEIARLLIIVTDGRSTIPAMTLASADKAKVSGMYIYMVGVSDAIYEPELRQLASTPQNVFYSHTFQDLRRDLLQATNEACTSTTITIPPPIIDVCYQLDLVIAIDGSNSMFEDNFNIQKQAIADLVQHLDVSHKDLRVGLVLFSGEVASFPLNGNKQQVIRDIYELQYPDAGTRTDLAINEASRLFMNSRGGNISKLLILVTDGRATYSQKAIEAAKNAKSSGITIYAVGVTDAIYQQELESLASSPKQVFYSHNFQSLRTDLVKAATQACEITTPAPWTPRHITTPTPPPATPAPWTPRHITTPTPPSASPACNQLDLVVAIDGSNSMFQKNFEIQKQAVVNLVNNLDVSADDMRVGLVLFSGDIKSFELSGNKRQVIAEILGLGYSDDATRTDLAINEASKLFRNARGGDVRKLLILVTDGRATYAQQAFDAAKNAKASGITIYAVGVTDAINQKELQTLASSPNHVFFSNDFQSLRNDLMEAANKACLTVVITTPSPPIFQPDCNQLDLVIAIDGSNSMFQNNFNIQKQAIANLVNNLDVSDNNMRVGLVLFSGDINSFPLSGNKEQIIKNIYGLPYSDDATRTDLAIDAAKNLFRIARGGSVRKLLILVTDGRATNSRLAQQAAQNAKASGIIIYAVGVTDAINHKELETLASTPKQVFFSANFQSLQNDLMQAATRACHSTLPPTYVTPTPPRVTPHPVITPHACDKLDLVLAIDASNSVFQNNFNSQKAALVNLVRKLKVGPTKMRVAVVMFSDRTITFSFSGNRQQIINSIDSLQYADGSTRTDLAINEAIKLFGGARGGNVRKLLILVTDGRATLPQQALIAAQNAKNNGITIFAVGVSDAINNQELQNLASSPKQVFFSANYQQLVNDLIRAANIACLSTPFKPASPFVP